MVNQKKTRLEPEEALTHQCAFLSLPQLSESDETDGMAHLINGFKDLTDSLLYHHIICTQHGRTFDPDLFQQYHVMVYNLVINPKKYQKLSRLRTVGNEPTLINYLIVYNGNMSNFGLVLDRLDAKIKKYIKETTTLADVDCPPFSATTVGHMSNQNMIVYEIAYEQNDRVNGTAELDEPLGCVTGMELFKDCTASLRKCGREDTSVLLKLTGKLKRKLKRNTLLGLTCNGLVADLTVLSEDSRSYHLLENLKRERSPGAIVLVSKGHLDSCRREIKRWLLRISAEHKRNEYEEVPYLYVTQRLHGFVDIHQAFPRNEYNSPTLFLPNYATILRPLSAHLEHELTYKL